MAIAAMNAGLAQQQSAQQMHNQMQNAGLFNQYSGLAGAGMTGALNDYQQIIPGQICYADKPKPKQETTVANEKEILPDISITRVLKWGVVLIIAMALGKKVWAQFGKQLTERLEGAVKELL